MRTSQYDQLDKQLQDAVDNCIEAQSLAYAPYSQFYVGTCILLTNGEMYKGANQENASYPLCLCAERVALSYAAMHAPGSEIQDIVVSTSANLILEEVPAPPCGACRQVILEYQTRQSQPIRIILVGAHKNVWIYEHIEELLPYSFQPNFLKKNRKL